MTFQEWAVRWGISQQAFAELIALSIVTPEPDALAGGKKFEPHISRSEAYVQSAIRLEAPQRGVYLWRNNVGAGANVQLKDLCDECRMKTRRPIRWGLGNDSKALNETIKSADLIGLKPVLITADMVGTIIGKFFSRECKREDWNYSGTMEENAQLAWAALINSLGGDAKIVKATGSL